MENNYEQYIKLEKKFQEELHAQKRYYESELELLKSKTEYEKDKIRIRHENDKSDEIQAVKAYYDVKNTKDLAEQKSYYLKELESQKNWYEEEIKRKQKETEVWHENHLKEEKDAINKYYENKLKEKDEQIKSVQEKLEAEIAKYKEIEDSLSRHIRQQREYYENQLKPFKNIINIKKQLKNKLNFQKTKPSQISAGAVSVQKTQEIKPSAPSQTLKDKQKIIDVSEARRAKQEAQAVQETGKIKDVQKPKVSIILPVYNVGRYLKQSLDSLINQTLKDIEIICIDDGSADESYDILEEYKKKDKRIIVIHKENKGTGAARNDGLRLAEGECIGFVDPDDWVKPDMFERLYELIKEKKLDIAMCMPGGYDEKNNIYAPFPYFVDSNWENVIDDRVFNWRDLSPFKYPMCVWNKLYTKELFDKNNIDFAEGLDFEDHKAIFGTLLTAERMFFIREKLYIYRYNREGSVLTDNNRRLIDHMEIFNIVEKLMKDTNTFDILREDFLTYKIHNVLYYYSMIKDEYKEEYYKNMVKCIKDAGLTDEECRRLGGKYPVLTELLK